VGGREARNQDNLKQHLNYPSTTKKERGVRGERKEEEEEEGRNRERRKN
jgi:hypothetical protein